MILKKGGLNFKVHINSRVLADQIAIGSPLHKQRGKYFKRAIAILFWFCQVVAVQIQNQRISSAECSS